MLRRLLSHPELLLGGHLRSWRELLSCWKLLRRLLSHRELLLGRRLRGRRELLSRWKLLNSPRLLNGPRLLDDARLLRRRILLGRPRELLSRPGLARCGKLISRRDLLAR